MSLSRRSRPASPQAPAWDAVGLITMSIMVAGVELVLAAVVGAATTLCLTSSPDQPRRLSKAVLVLILGAASWLGLTRWLQARYGSPPALTKNDLREALAEWTQTIAAPSSSPSPKGGEHKPQSMVWTRWGRP